ncbi:MAG: rRNA maturation RNase YbeY [Flavobacteriales bacterium]|nr:rRNA maturation RNase YbeY [Flavobacteriales bacterium]
MADVSFHSEQTVFSISNEQKIVDWLSDVCHSEGQKLMELSFIFCSDNYLLDINRKHLNHDYYTDVITFDYTIESAVSGDVFISIDRVRENAETLGFTFENELHRIMVHSVLHLLGYKDKTKPAKQLMTTKEDFYLSLRSF